MKKENESFKETTEIITKENTEPMKEKDRLSNNFEKISIEKNQLKKENESFKGTIKKMRKKH